MPPLTGNSKGTVDKPVTTSSSGGLVAISEEATSEINGGSVTGSILQPPATSDSSTLILGVVIPIILVLVVAIIFILVLSLLYMKSVRKSHQIQTEKTPGI